jgi:hypothetical protein
MHIRFISIAYAFALDLDNFTEFAKGGKQNRNKIRAEILERHDTFLTELKWLTN